MANIRPTDLPAAASVATDVAIIVDTGAVVEKATPAQIVDAAIPLASEVEAIAGADNVKRVTPLRVKQAMDANMATTAALASTDPGKGAALVNTIRSETGASAVDLLTLLRMQWVFPEQFGAVGDGATDDTAALQSALATGFAVYIRAGKTYFASTGFLIDEAGATLIGAGTIKCASNNTTQLTSVNRPAVIAVTGSNVTIRGITVDANSTGTTNVHNRLGILGDDATGLTVDGVKAVNMDQGFIRVDGLVQDVSVLHCRHNSKGYGIWVQDPDAGSKNLTVDDFIFVHPASGQGDGIEVNAPTNGFSNVTISNSFVIGAWGIGLNAGLGYGFAKVRNVTMTNCHAIDCQSDGFHFEDGSENITLNACIADGCCVTATEEAPDESNRNSTAAFAFVTGVRDVTASACIARNTLMRPALSTNAGNGDFNENIRIDMVIEGTYQRAVYLDSVKTFEFSGSIVDANTSNAAPMAAFQIAKFGTNVSEGIKINARIADGTNPVRSISIGAGAVTNGTVTIAGDFRGCTTPAPDYGGATVETRGVRFSADAKEGTFTMGAAATTKTVPNGNVDQIGTIIVTPANAAARTLGGYVSAVTRQTQFTYTTPSAVGTEEYRYVIL